MNLASYVRTLDKEQNIKAGAVEGGDTYDFRMYPTCPPTTSIVFRGGQCWYKAFAFYPYPILIPSYTVDLTDTDKVSTRMGYSGYDYTFTNASWYVPCIVVLPSATFGTPPEPPDTWPTEVPDTALYLYGGTSAAPYMTEYETAAEAEDACLEIHGDAAAFYGIAIGGLILRNNGNIVNINQWMPVDKINRGRSYLFGQRRYGWEMG